MSWLVEQTDSDIQVMPLDDQITHSFTSDCVCGPSIDDSMTTRLVIHHSLDGREQHEEDA